MIWLHHHRVALALALQRLWAAPVNTLLCVLAIGIALALPAGGELLIDTGVQFAHSATPVLQISAYLRMTASDADVNAVRVKLASHPAVKRADFIAREMTLERFRRSEGLRDVIDVLPRNPFPNAFVLTANDDSPAALNSLAAELRQWPQIEHVQLDSDWVLRLDALLRFGRSAILTLALMLGVGLVAIVFNITRLQVLTRREEIVVSELLGATASFIHRPFLYLGTVLGSLGAAVAWCVVWLSGRWLGQPLQDLAELYGVPVQIVGLSGSESICLLVTGAALGWLGTTLSLRQHLGSEG